MKLIFLIFLILLVFIPNTLAHQPVMDMAPRWEEGYGFQVRSEYSKVHKQINKDKSVSTDPKQVQKVHRTWLEGVYTFKRWLRTSFKIPYISKEKTILENGVYAKKTGKGLGDLTLGLLLKNYTNLGSKTWNWAITPSFRLPTGNTSGNFAVSDGSFDMGVSFSTSIETEYIFQFYDLFFWKNGRGKKGANEGDVIGLDINVGIHPYHQNLNNRGVFLLLDMSLRHQNQGQQIGNVTGGTKLFIGPIIMFYQRNWMYRLEYSLAVYEKSYGTQFSRGNKLSLGAGVTF
ncbi:hypothetical protein A9Q84_12435 [Halobacteriovorax marinus]|uniref:Uncharacterized protein n=1 Tax=Halobacteriovorax marinus TaxID=97084 RepID=A0A1Y5FDT5_9BACT|nr:hypothetical protein A9Q84_12435 [Halobacteriovorax marinus]